MSHLMTEKHPLKRKSIKPSSSTVRGMLPAARFKALDASMQSLRAAGMRLEWVWRDARVGWVCAALIDDLVFCELRPTVEPLLGVIELPRDLYKVALSLKTIPEAYKAILKLPIKENTKFYCYEFELEATDQRDLFSNFIEALAMVFESKEDRSI